MWASHLHFKLEIPQHPLTKCRQRMRRQRRGKGAVIWPLFPPWKVGVCFPITSLKSIFHAFVAQSLFPLMVSFS